MMLMCPCGNQALVTSKIFEQKKSRNCALYIKSEITTFKKTQGNEFIFWLSIKTSFDLDFVKFISYSWKNYLCKYCVIQLRI